MLKNNYFGRKVKLIVIKNTKYLFLVGLILLLLVALATINQAGDDVPQITNNSNSTGTTGDPFTFNVTVVDTDDPPNNLTVNVSWSHGGLSGNTILSNTGGDVFEESITLDHSISDMTFTIWANDKSGNMNSSGPHKVTVTDNDPPSIDSITGNTVGTTGETTTIDVTFSDNIGVTTATLYYKTASASSWSSKSILGGSAGIDIPLDSVESWYYYVTVDDAAGNGPVGDPSTDGSVYYIITVSDNDLPEITDVTATPSSQEPDGYVNITATVTDNINVNIVKVDITGPAGFTPVNVTMSEGSYYYNENYSDIGLYNYTIWAEDDTGNGELSSIYQFEIVSELIISNMSDEWNFVSLPFNQSVDKDQLFVIYNGSEYNWTEATTGGDPILVSFIFGYNRSIQLYEESDVLEPGYCYWMYAYKQCTLKRKM